MRPDWTVLSKISCFLAIFWMNKVGLAKTISVHSLDSFCMFMANYTVKGALGHPLGNQRLALVMLGHFANLGYVSFLHYVWVLMGGF